MVAVTIAFLAIAIAVGCAPRLREALAACPGRFVDPAAYAARVLDAAPAPVHAASFGEAGMLHGALTALAACVVALGALFHERLPERVRRAFASSTGRGVRALRRLQSGHVADYVSFLTLGVACFGGLCAWMLRR